MRYFIDVTDGFKVYYSIDVSKTVYEAALEVGATETFHSDFTRRCRRVGT